MVESGEALMLCAHTCVTGRKACVGELIFRRIDMSPRSVLSAGLTPGRRKGICLYVFDDGTAYVGKSVDMVGRYAQHMREYRHREDFDDMGIARAYFASVDADTDADTLDGLEAETIRRAEAVGYRLRNKLKCGRPGGDVGEVLDLREGRMLLLPWNCAAKMDSLERAALPEATASQSERLERLAALPECDVRHDGNAGGVRGRRCALRVFEPEAAGGRALSA